MLQSGGIHALSLIAWASLLLWSTQISVVSAERPPRDMKCAKIENKSGGDAVFGCKEMHYFCYTGEKHSQYMEPKLLMNMPYSPTDSTSVSKGFSHTSTRGWSLGAKVDFAVPEWATFLKGVDIQANRVWSEADAKNTQARVPCPADVWCGLMAMDKKVQFHGMHYIHNVFYPMGLEASCLLPWVQDKNQKGKPFTSHFPIIQSNEADQKAAEADVMYYACAHGEPAKEHPPCPFNPEDEDPRKKMFPPPPANPPANPPVNPPVNPPAQPPSDGSPCNVNGLPGTCHDKFHCPPNTHPEPGSLANGGACKNEPDNAQCCISNAPCQASGKSGTCNKRTQCPPGTRPDPGDLTKGGACRKMAQDVECCIAA